MQQFLAYGRANPGKLNYGMFGAGSTAHLNMVLLEAPPRGDEVHADPLQGRRTGAHRPARRAHPGDVRRSMGPAVPLAQKKQVKVIAVGSAQARRRPARRADVRRPGQPARLPRHVVVRPVRAAGHGSRGRREDQRRRAPGDRRSARSARSSSASTTMRSRVPRRISPGRIATRPAQMAQGHPGCGREGRSRLPATDERVGRSACSGLATSASSSRTRARRSRSTRSGSARRARMRSTSRATSSIAPRDDRDPHGYFLRFAGDHHAFVLFPRWAFEAARIPKPPGSWAIAHAAWEVGTLREVAEGLAWATSKAIRLARPAGRDLPGGNWTFTMAGPDGVPHEIYYGMDQIGWMACRGRRRCTATLAPSARRRGDRLGIVRDRRAHPARRGPRVGTAGHRRCGAHYDVGGAAPPRAPSASWATVRSGCSPRISTPRSDTTSMCSACR